MIVLNSRSLLKVFIIAAQLSLGILVVLSEDAQPSRITGFHDRNDHIRARDLGIPFDGKPGQWNAITDVPGVQVGFSSIIEGEGNLDVGRGPVRTGVTAILPTGHEFRKVFAAVSSLNGNGELTGAHWIAESGFLEEPVLWTNTHSVGRVAEASIQWRQERLFHEGNRPYDFASLPVVGETWDGRLNDIHGFHVKKKHVFEALDRAASGSLSEGNVGGGTGMVCFRFKGGTGTSSRLVDGGFTLGVIVQANFGLREDFKVAGVPVGRELTDLMPEMNGILPVAEGNSILVFVATDAPMLPFQLERLTRRIPLGIQRTGGMGYNSSGDLFMAVSTAPVVEDTTGTAHIRMIGNDRMDDFFRAVVQATEEAILNALIAARTMTGINNNTIHALPHDRLIGILRKFNRHSPGAQIPPP